MRQLWVAGLLALAGASAQAAEPAIALVGKGVQIYACRTTDAGPAWQLKAPEAVLTDAAGRRVGDHFAGPSWRATDGSVVVGALLAASPAPQPGAIPWLVLEAKSHVGDGVFAHVAYIVRSATEGGAAPPGGCDASHVAAEIRVDYSATYSFFPR